MGKNKDGRRSNKKNSRKNTYNKYGKYTSRSTRIHQEQEKKRIKKVVVDTKKQVGSTTDSALASPPVTVRLPFAGAA